MSLQEITTGARAVRVVMDKHAAMEATGADSLELTTGEGARLVKELGQGFIAVLQLIRDVRTDLRRGSVTCLNCQTVAQALGELPHDDIERLFRDLE